MEQADQTLHDFVLNLLGDSQALAAFEQDPAAVLDHAGLSDISAADVQEVIPLVVDFVPAHADALDSIMSQLPLESVETGQIGAIQQLQFVTAALGGLPPFHSGGSFDAHGVHDDWNVGSDGDKLWGTTNVHSPLGGGTASLGGDLHHGMAGGVSLSGMGADLHAGMKLPGLDGLSVPSLGGGLPSGFSAMSDVTDALDGHLSSIAGTMNENATNTANLVAGITDFASGGLADPAALTDALANPAATLSALTGTAEAFAGSGASSLPAPAGAVAGEAMTTINSATHNVVSEVTSHLPAADGLQGVTSHLPLDPTHAIDTVQGLVGNVTSHLPTGDLAGLGDLSHVTSTLGDPSHALGTVTNTLSGVTGEVSGVASHSAVTDVLGSGGAGNLLGSLDHTTDVTGDLSHITNDLHLPGL